MIFTSFEYIFFLTLAVAIYYCIPKKYKNIFLLFFSYCFIGFSDLKSVVIIFVFSVFVYCSAIIVEKNKNNFLFIVILIILACPLIITKTSNIVSIIGVSYFSFKSIGYLIDVKCSKCVANHNFVSVLLYVSLFSEILIGPIDRSNNLLVQIDNPNRRADFRMIKEGVLMLLFGTIYKLVVADRISILVDTVYSALYKYEGYTIFLAACLYSLQIYFDFAGCSLMAIGTGRMLGFEHPSNFLHPYFSNSIKDFWRRWHISLTSWLRDYIYIPLGGNKKGTFRKYINIIVVFLFSGLWHGFGYTFAIWGLLNGIFQVIEDIFSKKTAVFINKIKIPSLILKIKNFIVVTFCWIFFRANNISHALLIFRKMFSKANPWIFFDGTIDTLGLSHKNVVFLIIILLVIMFIEFKEEFGIDIYNYIISKSYIYQTLIFILLIFVIATFGIYGDAYDISRYIYMNF